MVTFHELLTEEQLQKEFISSLEIRDIPNKFTYAGKDQASNWINLIESGTYKNYEEPIRFIKEIREEICSVIKNDVNFISIGSANGNKPKIILKQLLKNVKVKFHAIDESIQVAQHTISNMQDINIKKEVFISQLNHENMTIISNKIRQNGYKRHFFTVLSNTFGVHPTEVISKAIRNSMNGGDYLLIGVHVLPNYIEPKYIQDTMKRYSTPAIKERTISALKLANITMEHGEVEVEYNTDPSSTGVNRITHYFRFNKALLVQLGGEEIYFGKDERIRIKYSTKYRINILRQVLEDHGFSIKKEFLSPNKEYIKVLCKLS